MNIRIVLLSDINREDVHSLWRASMDAYWPTCPFPVTIMDQDTRLGWSRCLLNVLNSTEEEEILLWVDDNALSRPVLVPDLERCLRFFVGHGDVALLHVGRSHKEWWATDGGLIRIPELEPFAYYAQNLDHLTRAMVPHPALWRKKALIQITEREILTATPEQDDGWAGFYNWELGGGYVLLEHNWRAIVMIGDYTHDCPQTPIFVCNAVRQGMGWTGCAYELAERIGFTLNPVRGRAARAEEYPTPGSDKWRAAGHVRRHR